MSQSRIQEVWISIVAALDRMGIGPNRSVPVKTVWLAATKQRITIDPKELDAALQWATEQGLATFSPGGIAGLGSIVVTDLGYERFRNA